MLYVRPEQAAITGPVANDDAIGTTGTVGGIRESLMTALVHPFGRWLMRRDLSRQLSSLDDRLLEDIGISRYQIPQVVANTVPGAPSKKDGHPRYGKGLMGAIKRWQGRREAVRELESLDDRMLEDIGIQRSQIRAIVTGTVRAPDVAVAPSRPGRPATWKKPARSNLGTSVTFLSNRAA